MLEEKVGSLETKKINEIHSSLGRWQRVQLARHPDRPYSKDYIDLIFTDFVELHGDRLFADDPAVICGIAKLDHKKVVIIAQQKGRNTKDNLYRNFGMMRPEGYRKALRIMKLAEKFNLPVITFMDTPGAFPGIGAEERGQGEAIARNLLEMSSLKVPIISIVIGEGASGGALGIGVCDRFLMMQNTWYSVISPEGCASILFRDATKAKEAAEALKVIPDDLVKMGICDKIIIYNYATKKWSIAETSASTIFAQFVGAYTVELMDIISQNLENINAASVSYTHLTLPTKA